MSNTNLVIQADRAFEPNDMNQAMGMAKTLYESGLLPGIKSPQAAFTIIVTGRELGLTAMQSLRGIHIINGKPCLSADLIVALCKSRGDVCTYFRMVHSDATYAEYTTLRQGDPEPTTLRFTIEQAKRANLLVKQDSNWQKYPEAMLRARCISALARAVYPDLAMGLYESESGEIEERQPAPQREPQRVTVQQGPALSPAKAKLMGAAVHAVPHAPASEPRAIVEAVEVCSFEQLQAEAEAFAEDEATLRSMTARSYKAGVITGEQGAAIMATFAARAAQGAA